MRRSASEIIRNLEQRIARLERRASPHGQVGNAEFLSMLVRKFKDSRFVGKLELDPRANLDKATTSSSSVLVGKGKTAKGGLIGIYASSKGITFDIDGRGYVYDGAGASFIAKFTYSDHFVTEKALFGKFSENVEKEGFDLI